MNIKKIFTFWLAASGVNAGLLNVSKTTAVRCYNAALDAKNHGILTWRVTKDEGPQFSSKNNAIECSFMRGMVDRDIFKLGEEHKRIKSLFFDCGFLGCAEISPGIQTARQQGLDLFNELIMLIGMNHNLGFAVKEDALTLFTKLAKEKVPEFASSEDFKAVLSKNNELCIKNNKLKKAPLSTQDAKCGYNKNINSNGKNGISEGRNPKTNISPEKINAETNKILQSITNKMEEIKTEQPKKKKFYTPQTIGRG